MSWTDTHRRWQALAEIEVLANAGCDELPWNTEYAAIFGDRDELAAALRYRWELNQSTQLDTHLSEAVLEEQRRRLMTRSEGLLRLLENHERRTVHRTLSVVTDQQDTCTEDGTGDRVPA